MKKNLSSQITLTRIPTKYYRPENAYELSVLTRFERISTSIYESADEGSATIAKEIATEIRKKQEAGKMFVLAIPGGRSPQSVFKELIKLHKEGLSFKNVIVFNIYEFYPLVSEANSNIGFLKDALLDHIDIDPANIHTPDGFMSKEVTFEFCNQYEEQIAALGGIDYILLGVGHAGNLGFNSPGSTPSSRTRLVLLDNDARKEAANTFKSIENVPASVITMGMSTILAAKKIILMAWGENKSKLVQQTVENKVSDAFPASFLQTVASKASLAIDLSAASQLTRISRPWLVTSCEWDNKLIRRAIVWLCQLTGKPILKLTNKDYSEHGLGELLALYGSAYNVNIKIFNDIQHTITGWPGGKPNADDSNRPERATPYPKRVIIFSPHPDDDVISMGGTFRRLCDQHHDVYVAYQTSGNIAVADEEVVRYCEYLRDVCEKYAPGNNPVAQKAEEILHYLRNEKEEGVPEHKDVLFMKGTIRREEARAGARHCGISQEDHIRFLDLPFYETGLVKKNDISEKDKDIIKDFIEEVKPHQIFVAGDLADPHGTHKVCLDAILAAVDEVKDDEWMKECRIWMYRGAWAEWEMDHIEMAVPISPEELRLKRIAILKHQSQAENAPFLGDDERLFWQRAEDRNRATAELYRDLGLASYEAMEAFVKYIPVR